MQKNKIRLLQALTTGEIGGTELMVLQLIKGLDRSEFICEVAFLDGFGPLSKRFQEVGVTINDLSGAGGPIGSMWRLLLLLKDKRYDIINLYGFRMSLVGRLVARMVRPHPIVISGIRDFHLTEVKEILGVKSKISLAIEKVGSVFVDAYIANSHEAAEFLSKRGLRADKFLVVPNGIDPSEWNSRGVRGHRDTSQIICVANFRPKKHQRDLIDAVSVLASRGVKVHCLLLGDGMMRKECESLAQSRGLANTIKFLGKCDQKDVMKLLQEADIFVLPSLWEGMPVSVMEAMAAGLPVIGSDVPGIRELVVDGITGYLVSPKNPVALAERIEYLLKDPILLSRMGEAGHRRISEEYSLERMVHRHQEAYRSLLQGRAFISHQPLSDS